MTSERAEAVAELLRRIDEVVSVGPVDWSESRFSYLDLAINYTLRRQREALGASLPLIEGGLGHLSVGFVRPALDEWLWSSFLGGLDPAKANELLEAMGRYDGRRSLKAQRDHVGDAVMAELWFPSGFVDAQVDALAGDKDRLSQLGAELGWGKGKTPLPTARWLAEPIRPQPDDSAAMVTCSGAMPCSISHWHARSESSTAAGNGCSEASR